MAGTGHFLGIQVAGKGRASVSPIGSSAAVAMRMDQWHARGVWAPPLLPARRRSWGRGCDSLVLEAFLLFIYLNKEWPGPSWERSLGGVWRLARGGWTSGTVHLSD